MIDWISVEDGLPDSFTGMPVLIRAKAYDPIMLCQDNIAKDFKTSDEAKLFIDDLIEVEGNE